MIFVPLFLTLSLLSPPVRVPSACPPAPVSKAAEGQPYFDFQVDTPARFVGADSVLPVPDAKQHSPRPYPPDFALAQFVVDTAGVPVAQSLKMLVMPTGLALDAVQHAITTWRFSPAVVQGCRVPQLVMTPLKWHG